MPPPLQKKIRAPGQGSFTGEFYHILRNRSLNGIQTISKRNKGEKSSKLFYGELSITFILESDNTNTHIYPHTIFKWLESDNANIHIYPHIFKRSYL